MGFGPSTALPWGLLPSQALPARDKATATVPAHREPAGWARPRWASSPGAPVGPVGGSAEGAASPGGPSTGERRGLARSTKEPPKDIRLPPSRLCHQPHRRWEGAHARAHSHTHTVTRTHSHTQSHAHSHTQSHAPSFSQVSNPRASHGFLKGFARLAVRGRRPGPSGSHGPAPFALRVSRRVAPQGAPRAAVGAGSAGTGE